MKRRLVAWSAWCVGLMLVGAVGMRWAHQADGAGPATGPTTGSASGASTNSIGMKMVHIPHGEFMDGSADSEARRSGDERRHKVIISKDFFMSATPVTEAQWTAVMEKN